MSILKSRVSLSYHELALALVEAFALRVKAGYYGHNPPFTVLTLTEAAFLVLITNFESTRIAHNNGGEDQKGDFLLAKTALMEGLDFLAKETDKVANGNPEVIVLSGFDPTKGSTSEPVKPGQPVVTVKRGIAGELISICPKMANANHYGCLVTEGSPKPDWVVISEGGKVVVTFDHPEPPVPGPEMTAFVVDLTEQREKHFLNLKPGVTYYFYYYAVNATGVGPLSEVESIMCA